MLLRRELDVTWALIQKNERVALFFVARHSHSVRKYSCPHKENLHRNKGIQCVSAFMHQPRHCVVPPPRSISLNSCHYYEHLHSPFVASVRLGGERRRGGGKELQTFSDADKSIWWFGQMSHQSLHSMPLNFHRKTSKHRRV